MRLTGVMQITERLDACAEFYAALVGREPERGAGWARFTLPDGSMIALHTPWSADLAREAGSSVTLVGVASLEDERVRLAAAGLVLGEPHDIPGGAVATIADPDGRLVQLMETRA
jgi:predicted enzyme related to lactoylglutathione lyase